MISYQNRTGLKLRVLSPINFTACRSFCLTTEHPFFYMKRTHFQIDFSAHVIGSETILEYEKKNKKKNGIYNVLFSSLSDAYVCVCLYICMLYVVPTQNNASLRTFFTTSTQFSDSRFLSACLRYRQASALA